MPNAKRASMREGPLAALFRKTAQDSAPTPDSKPAQKKARKREPEPAEQTAAAAAQEADEAAAETLSPRERLRHVFSSDIPMSLMESEAQDARPERPASVAPRVVAERDVYALDERDADALQRPGPFGRPVLRVVGVGGGGVNAVNRMIEAEIEGVEFIAVNTDLQSLQTSAASETLHIGNELTRGLGSGSDPKLGREAARAEYDRIKSLLRGSDMVFIAAGAGGGTGTGAAPIVAQISREIGALTVGIVTRPFQFEGTRRREQAEIGIEALSDEVDTLIVVPNNKLLTVLDRETSMVEAFRVADDVLRQGVQGISDLVTLPGLINLDFADVRTIMSDAGNALLGIGMGTGEQRAMDAAEKAVSSPLLETSMDGARSILLSITGGPDLSLWEVNESAKAVAEAAHPDANIIFGAMLDEKLRDGQVWVTVVATGFPDSRGRSRTSERSGASERPVAAIASGRAGAGRDDEREFGTGRDRERVGALREPDGEPRVTRQRERSYSALDFDVPEFLPRR